jgi:amino-acid N-acetyltransferase
MPAPLPGLAKRRKPAINRRMIRKAAIPDIPEIHRLLALWGARGDLLARPLSQLYDHLRDFRVWAEPAREAKATILGCCGLQFCWEDLAEIRSLAVHPDHQGRKIGRMLVETAMEEARAFGVQRVFTLTYRPAFFEKLGFQLIDRAELPLKIWSDCVACVNFPNCDENAMMMELNPPPPRPLRNK